MAGVAGAVRTRKRGQLRFLVTPESLRNAMMEQALETGKQQDVLELAQLAQVSCALCYSRLWADNGKTIRPRCVFPTIARSNRYNRAFCPAVPSSISPDRYFPA
ncbi:hypothetical protein ECZU34_34810 [Escherichia coli]|nr:hypothetical protein ECZU34_34810 [Escherichia coli]